MMALKHVIADVQHQIWAHWMKYVFSIFPEKDDGTVTISADKVKRWKRQCKTDYCDLTEKEQASDLDMADRVIAAYNQYYHNNHG